MSDQPPTSVATLLDVLLHAVEVTPDQVIVEVDADGGEQEMTFAQLLERSRRVAGGLRATGQPVGTPVIVLPDRAVEFLPSFWGAVAAGLVPVPLAAVPDKVAAVWAHLGRPPLLVTSELARQAAQLLVASPSPAPDLLRLEDLLAADPLPDLHRPSPDDVAFLQFSSGSTGAPKGVVLTHANVLANLEQAREAGAATASDVLVSWLPYFHDMGLIGAHLTPLFVGAKQVKLAAADFAARPALWFETATEHRATLLPMASFALALTVKRVTDHEVVTLDLTSVRLVGVGAEPIPVAGWRRFLRHLAPAGLSPTALVPVYGLAEATLAVAFPPLGELAQPLRLDRRALADGHAVDVRAAMADDGVEPAEFLDVGYPVSGGALRVVDEHGAVLPDSRVGQIEFRGPNVARGYHRRPEETGRTFVGGWLRTGDVGFLRAGRLCVTGRCKDVLFVHGQTFHAHDLEQVATATPGAPSGRVAVVGSTDPVSGVERVTVFVSSRERPTTGLAPALAAVRASVREALGYDHVVVLPIRPADFPRTTSGKVQRTVLRERLAAGAYAALEGEVASAASDVPRPAPPKPPKPVTSLSRRDVEAEITRIWAEVLEQPAVSISPDDRFLAIGGTSLTAMHVLGRLEEAFDRSLPPALLRDCATVAALAEQLSDRAAAPESAQPVPSREPVTSPERSGTALPPPPADTAAVVGMACRFPDADTPEAFWRNLAAGRDSVTEVPPDRWSAEPGAPRRYGGFLADVAGFDAGFFALDPAEAAATDPHARVFLEVAHEALERAGYAGERRRGRRIGVFVAVGESGYGSLLEQALTRGVPLPPSALVGNLRSVIAARVAHHLDLSGPALVVDTACSSALVALHLARQSLQAGECDAAVVGGVSLNLTRTGYRLLEAAQALSPTGRSRAFSAGADGFVPGEGAAALVLEPLGVAERAGDQVLALVRGSTVNNDGRSLSLMAPNPLLQKAVIADAYRDAGIDPATIGYVEAHGTGTAIGDPIEARSLIHTFGAARADGLRGLGSVKTNVGHLLNAAGLPSLLKVILSLGHRALPPSLHYARPAPSFDLAAAGFEVLTELRDWTADGPLRAGINGFGFGGTNAHVILEEAPPPSRKLPPEHPSGPQLLTLSAATEPALRVAAVELAAYARTHAEIAEADLCHSASTARDARLHRLSLVVDGDLADQLERAAAAATVGTVARRRPRLALVFAGQGTQLPGLGRAWRGQPTYRQVMDELSDAAGEVRGRSLTAWSLDDVAPAELAATAVAQPLLVAYAIALTAQLDAWGIRADAVLGHSVGELAALAVAGAVSPGDAVRFAAARGELMEQRCPAGAMAALVGSASEVQALVDEIGHQLSVAAVNGPERVVVSGSEEAVRAALARWSERGRPGQRLAVSRAFHSAAMEPALEQLRRLAADLAPQPYRIPLLSTVHGEWNPTLDASYIAAQARQPVQFAAAVQRLLTEGYDTLLTVEPGSALRSLTASVVRAEGRSADVAVSSLVDTRGFDPERGGEAAVLRTVGRLWERGVSITRPVEQPPRLRQPVPTYPYQHTRYWLPEPVGRPRPAVAPAERKLSALLHRFTWRQQPLPAGTVLTSVAVVGEHSTLAPALSDRLTRRGLLVHRCPVAELDALPPVSVVVLLADPSAELHEVQALDTSTRSAAETMPALARWLARRPTPLVVVTEDATVTGAAAERARPSHAVLAGLALALAGESREHGVRVVDLSTLDAEHERLDALVRELDAPPAAGPAGSVTWRRGRRLTRTPQADAVGAGDRPPLPPDGCYLITGGSGGVGSALARGLAARGAPRLYLVGRAPQGTQGLLAELDALGAESHYVSADCADAADIDALVDALPALDGVFHAAGVLVPGLLAATSAAEVEAGWAVKVRGSFLLARALHRAGNRPDVFVTFSSIASALPGYAGGLGAYAAAATFLDAFAAAEQHAGRPMQVLDLAAWSDTGMAASTTFRAHAERVGLPEISAEQGVEAVLDATTVGATQLLVMDLQTTTVDAPPRVPSPVASPPLAPATDHRSEPADAAATPSGAVRDVVATLIAAELGLLPEDLDDDASLLSMGLDSLAAVDLVRKLEAQLGRELPTTLLFEHPSIAQLSARLANSPATVPPEAPPPAAHLRAPLSEPFPLAPVQLGFHTSGRLHPELSPHAYLRQTIVGELDEVRLARSLALLERRHPMLRLRIQTENGQPQQSVRPPGDGDRPEWFATRTLSDPAPQVDWLSAIEDELCNRVLDLAQEPPLRVLLVQSPERSSLLVLLHHAAGDGASLTLLCAELWQVYTSLSQHHSPDLSPFPSTFRDHVDLLDRQRHSEDFEADLGYWAERLQTRAPSPALPYDCSPPPDSAGPLTAHQFGLDRDLTAALGSRAAQVGVSLFHLVLSAYLSALASWTGDPCVTVNVARAGREARLPGIGRIVGPFADTLPITLAVDAHPPGDLPRAVRDAWRESEQHGTVSSVDLARLLPARDTAPRTAGAAGFSFARFGIELPDCPVRIVDTAARTASAATRLSLVCWEFEGALRFSWNYPGRLFAATTVQRFTDDLRTRLTSLVEPEHAEPPLPSVARRIRDQCRRAPNAVAVDSDEGPLSYSRLDRAAGRLASRLHSTGIRPSDRVALLTRPGADTVVGLLGILYAGATWVPLDPAHPPARLRALLDRSHADAVVAHEPTRSVAALLGPIPLVLAGRGRDEHPVPDLEDQADPAPDDVAYIIFTSGTTAAPKGVPITHRAMATYLDWAVATFGYRPGDRMLATASICFDASVRQLLAPLLAGATIVTADRDTVRDPGRLLDLVEQQGVTVWSSVPTLWEQVLRSAVRRVAAEGNAPDLSALRWVHVGGEALSPEPVRRWFDLFGPDQRLVNLYGPTEATINATFHVVDSRPDDSATRIPIGRPAAGAVVDVVGSDGVSCSAGEPGELWVAGPGLTPGYLDQPDLTASAFGQRGGMRYYRTGDRAVRRPDGCLDFLGRIDQQVKIRGHRVEPGEIESALRSHPDVERAVVVTQPARDAGGPRLVGYAQPREGGPAVTSDELRRHLTERLPDYLVPAQLTVVDALPLTVTGKLDVAALAQLPARPSRLTATDLRTPPWTPTEHLVAAVWQDLLRLDEVRREDDFFALGGDSIAVLEVFARLESHLPHLPAPTALYAHRTLADLAAAIDSSDLADTATRDGRPAPPEPPPPTSDPFPLSPAQTGFLLAEAWSPEADPGWLASFRVTGPLDPSLFQRAVDRLVARHPMLRTVILAARRPAAQQELLGDARLAVEFSEIETADLVEHLAAERRRRFDAADWPLIRLQVLRLAPLQHVLVVHAHHLIGDGYSVVVLAQDLLALYDEAAAGNSDTLPVLRSTFRDYVALQRAQSEVGTTRVARPERREAPYDPPHLRRAEVAMAGPGQARFTLDRRATSHLRQLALDCGVTPFAPVLTGYYRALVRLTDQPDLLLGVAVTGRDHALPDLNRMVGPLATVIPVRLRDLRSTFPEQLPQVAQAVRDARTSGATIQQRVRVADGAAGPSSFGAQLLFSYLDFDALGALAGERLRLEWDEHGTDLEPPPFGTDLLVTARLVQGCLQVTVRAARGVLTADRLDAFAADLRHELTTGPGWHDPETRTLVHVPPAGIPVLDAALIGYLPTPRDLAALTGVPATEGLRQSIRSALFPDGQPRLLEELSTPFGRSGFLCLPVFADELAPLAGSTLAADVARAVQVAGTLGAGAVSLAGMIPANTAYGFDVRHALGPATPRVTTGHATTAASVVKTTMRALEESGSRLSERTMTVLGLGSIGWSSLQLLLALDLGVPKRLLLCDLATRAEHLAALTEILRERGYPADFTVCGPDRLAPARAYEADLVVAAISAGRPVLDTARLRPGTIVVDDSFPHCFDPTSALRRMADAHDVLVVGGGLLTAGRAQHRPVDDPLLQPHLQHLTGLRIPDTVASCQLEALLQISRPELPTVHGLVDVTLALTYWQAMVDLGVRAAPLHLQDQLLDPAALSV